MLLLVAWLAGTSILATCHDHDPLGRKTSASSTERGASTSTGPCLVCRVSHQNILAQVAPVGAHVPDAPPNVEVAPVARPSRARARSTTRLRAPPRLLVEA